MYVRSRTERILKLTRFIGSAQVMAASALAAVPRNGDQTAQVTCLWSLIVDDSRWIP
jgi:hypothetical protein